MTALNDLSDSLASVVDAVAPHVARVELRCGSATATAWSTPGVWLTASHALGDAERVTLALADGSTVEATVAGRDAGTDVAVLRVADGKNAVPNWSDGESLRVGNLVLPVGRPGRTARATLGMLSVLGEGFRTRSGGRIDRYLEVDGTLPRGFSGGPLADASGALVGLNTAALVRGGGTVPTVTLRRVVTALLEHGRLGRGYLGVHVYPASLSEAHAKELGQRGAVAVVGLEPGGAAQGAGVLVGDVLVSLDGAKLTSPGELFTALEGKGGVAATLELLRGGERKTVTITPTERS